MKKVVISFAFLVLLSGSVFAQKTASKANHNTAVRCLKLSESCLVSGDWQDALKQSELGISYDDSISDLYYVKAAAESGLGSSRKKILEVIRTAFTKNNWIEYSRNGARILFADLLCDTGLYRDSLALLDEAPLVYSADAEFIRIKNYYRSGTEADLKEARLRVDTARRVYSKDSRFPLIFFMFEFQHMMNDKVLYGEYTVPEKVKKIADSYILKLPDYKGENLELELLASFFAEEETKIRLVKAIATKGQTKDPLLAIAGLETGLYSENEALEMFFEYSGENVSLFYMDCLISMLSDEQVIENLLVRLSDFSATVYIDDNNDLQSELVVKYSLGRPAVIMYDGNNDGERDLYASCDYGTLEYVLFDDENIELNYDVFPYVKRFYFKNQDFGFDFLYDDFAYAPVLMNLDFALSSLGYAFFTPAVSFDYADFDYKTLAEKCTKFELPITERENARIAYTMIGGHAVFADFYENNSKYAYCDFAHGIPFVRYVDFDLDGYFETQEIYDVTGEKKDSDITVALTDPERVGSIFNNVANEMNVILKKIQIDRNGNTFMEYAEEYFPDSTACYWDDNDDGITDYKYTKRTSADSRNVYEETEYYDKEGKLYISISMINSIPVKMSLNDEEAIIYSGKNKFVYWIDMPGSDVAEKEIMNYVQKGVVQGNLDVVSSGADRVLVIRVGKNYFCRFITAAEEDQIGKTE